MKTRTKTEKDFDAVELMRSIRTTIDRDIEAMTFKQEKEYFKKGAERARKYKPVNGRR